MGATSSVGGVVKHRMARKILVFLQGTIGDTVVAVPALRALRRHYGMGASISLLHETHRHLASTPKAVLAGLGLVDEFIDYPCEAALWAKASASLELALQLLHKGFDVVYYLIASERTARQIQRDNLFFRLCGIRQRHGFRGFDDERLRPLSASGQLGRVQQESVLLLSVIAAAGVDVAVESSLQPPLFTLPESAKVEAENWLRQRPAGVVAKTLIAIAPGAKKSACLWPLDRFAAVGKALVQNWGATLIVVGGPAERDAGIALNEAWNGGLNACGQLSVLGTAALLERCNLLVGLDTGTTHLAAAVGTPCVALYAAQDWPGRWEPIGNQHTVLRRSVICAGCRLKVCTTAGHPCMMGISVEEVLAAISNHIKTRFTPNSGQHRDESNSPVRNFGESL